MTTKQTQILDSIVVSSLPLNRDLFKMFKRLKVANQALPEDSRPLLELMLKGPCRWDIHGSSTSYFLGLIGPWLAETKVPESNWIEIEELIHETAMYRESATYGHEEEFVFDLCYYGEQGRAVVHLLAPSLEYKVELKCQGVMEGDVDFDAFMARVNA